MITLPDSYALRNESGIQDTVYVLHIGGDIDTYYSTEAVKGLSTAQLIESRPSLIASSLQPLAGTSSIGAVSVVLTDISQAITTLRRAYRIRGQEATLSLGYKGLPWDDYIQVISGRITRFERQPDGLSYSLEVSDKLERLDLDIFQAADIAAEPYTAATKSFDSGSLVLSDEDADLVYDTVTLTGHPVDLALKVLFSGGDAAGAATSYNVWPVWAGCALAEADVDIAWFLLEKAKIATVPMEIILSDGENAKSFIETELCNALGGYLRISGTGAIRIRYMSTPSPADATADVMSDAVLTAKPIWGDASDVLVTHIDYEMDHDGSSFDLQLPRRASPQYLADPTIEERVLKISSRGLKSALGGISIADAVMDLFFQRYGNPPPKVRLQAFFRRHTVEPGDVIPITSDYYPDVDGKGVGGTRYLEVLSVKPSAFKVDIEAIDLTAPIEGGTPAVISPTGTPVFGSASEAELAAYAWLADDATGELSDGTPAWIWS